MAVEQGRQALAAAWALAQMGAQNYNNLCQRFIENAYGTGGQYRSAHAAGQSLIKGRDLKDADVGDLIFFRPDASNGGAGHAAIYVGNGEMVGAIQGGVKRTKIMDGGYWQGLFAGFADPPPAWKGVPSTPQLIQGAATLAAGGAAMAGDQPRAQSLQPIAQWGGAGRYLQEITAAAQKYGIPVNMLAAKVNAESGGDPNATSPVGAKGLLQLMPATARSLGVTDVNNIAQNLDAGAKYFKQMYDQFGSWEKALRAYNAGPAGNWNNTETNNHVRRVFQNMNAIAQALPTGGGAAPAGGAAGGAAGGGAPPPPGGGGDRDRDQGRTNLSNTAGASNPVSNFLQWATQQITNNRGPGAGPDTGPPRANQPPAAPAAGATPPAGGADMPIAGGSPQPQGAPPKIPAAGIRNAALRSMAENHNRLVDERAAAAFASAAITLPPETDPNYARIKAQKDALDLKVREADTKITAGLPSLATGIQNETPAARTDQIVPSNVVGSDQPKIAIASTDADGKVTIRYEDNPAYREGQTPADISAADNAALAQRAADGDAAAMARLQAQIGAEAAQEAVRQAGQDRRTGVTEAGATERLGISEAGATTRATAQNTSQEGIAAGNQNTQRATSALAAAVQQEAARISALIESGKLDLAEATQRFNEWKTKNVDVPLAVLTQQRETAKLQLEQQNAISSRASGQAQADTARANAGTSAYTAASGAYNETMKQTISSEDAAMAQGTMNYNPATPGQSGNQYGTGTFQVNESMDQFASRKAAEALAGISPYAQNILASTQQMGDPGAFNSGAMAAAGNQALGQVQDAMASGGPNAGRVQPSMALPAPVNIGAMASAGQSPAAAGQYRVSPEDLNKYIPNYGA